jgi:nucleotide-binding universal stress UspA family protein
MNFKKILVPVDFSKCSGAALDYAMRLAKALDAKIEVVHAFEMPTLVPPHVVVVMGEVQASLSEHAEREARRQFEAFLTEHGVTRETPRELLLGPAGLTIVERLASKDVDLVVMGTHGRTGLRRWVMGSTAEKVLREAPCPVLTVRTKEED